MSSTYKLKFEANLASRPRGIAINIRSKKHQRGAAALLFATFAIALMSWYAMQTFKTIADASGANRAARTAKSLKIAKEAVLAWVAMNAARSSELYPGRVPCPEVRSLSTNATYQGYAGPFNSTTSPSSATSIACDAVGHLPWKTLGLDQLLDGDDEPLWFAVPMGTWAWTNVDDSLTINPGSSNQLSYDGTASAVAVIIAPGKAINSTGETGTAPTGCSMVGQARSSTGTPTIANYLECGNESGSYKSVVSSNDNSKSQWSNDRAIAITASEVMDAIAGAVQSRLQKEIAPTLTDLAANTNWHTNEANTNWSNMFLPYASTFSAATSNDLCGNYGTTEGILPIASSVSSTCANWSDSSSDYSFSATTGRLCTSTTGSCAGSTGYVPAACTQTAGASSMQCKFAGRASSSTGPVTVAITVRAPFAAGFRKKNSSPNPTSSYGTVSGTTFSIPTSGTYKGYYQLSFNVSATTVPRTPPTLFTVTVPNLTDAAFLSDTRLAWFVNNYWHRYTYYSISSDVSISSQLTSPGSSCSSNCLMMANLPAANGSTSDKVMVLTLMGRALSGQTQPSDTVTNYLETHTVGLTTFTMQAPGSTANDRHAGCPYTISGATICN